MKDQHTLIKGYRDLNKEEIDLMNRIKEFGADAEKLVEDIECYLRTQPDPAVCSRITKSDARLWCSEGKLSLQRGIMFLVRSVAQPSSF